jgi:biopolymer transport protein ExbB/TolQ
MNEPLKQSKKIRIQSLRRSPLREWLIVFGVFSCLIVAFLGWLMVEAVRTDTTGLSVVIFLVFCLAIAKNFFDVKYVNDQVRLADTQIGFLVETNDLAAFLRNSKRSLFKDHIHNLYEMSKRDTELSQDNLVTIIQSKVYSRIRLMENAASILVTAGLIGTIVGLIASVAGLDGVMSSIGKDQDQMLRGFRETISGMSTAFYTTLVGAALGGIGIRILTNVVESNAEFLVGHLAELAEVYIIPSLRASSKRNAKLRETEAIANAVNA